MKLLLIEDDPETAEVLAESFRADGHETIVAHTGEAGLERIRSEQPEAVVLDLRLPGLDGISVLRTIRQTDSSLPVIIMSGWATPAQLAEARRLGVTEIIEKPSILKHFSSALARLTKHRGPSS